MGVLRRVNKSAGKPTVQIETLTAVCKMTRRDVFLEGDQMMNLLMLLPIWDGLIPTPAILKPKRLWTGKQLFSQIIPDNINVIRTHYTHPDNENDSPYKWISPGDTKVLVERGELICGIICERSVGNRAGSLLQIIKVECGCQRARNFSDHLSIVANNWIEQEGHTLAIADVICEPYFRENIKTIMNHAKLIVERELNELSEQLPGHTLKRTFEEKLNSTLQNAYDAMGRVMQRSLSPCNNLWNMVVSGSNVSLHDVQQSMVCVGQQRVMNKCIPFGFRGRSLPHFIQNHYGIDAGSFVEDSYVSGLSPSEFFFNAMAERANMIDKLLTNANYTLRQFTNTMSSLRVKDNGTVQDGNGQLIQFLYGEDGIKEDAAEFQFLPTIVPSNKSFRKTFNFELWNERQLENVFYDDVCEEIKSNARVEDELKKEWQTLQNDRETLRSLYPKGNNKANLPCNLSRMVWNARKKFSIDQRSKTDFSPLGVIEGVRNLNAKLLVVPGIDRISRRANENATTLFRCLLRSTLCAKRVAEEFRLSTRAFSWLLGEIEARFIQARVQPGVMVGKLAARSFGEVVSKMNLKTFHYAREPVTNMTSGIPRLKEILNVSKRLKTPSTTVFLTGDSAKVAERAKDVLHRIEHTTLGKVVTNSAVYYDPDPFNTVVTEDGDFSTTTVFASTEHTPWVLRIKIKREMLTNMKLSAKNIREKIFAQFGDDLNCAFNDDNAETLVMRIRIRIKDENEYLKDDSDEVKMRDEEFLRRIGDNILSDLTLRGIESITKVYIHFSNTEDTRRIILNEKGQFEAVNEYFLETKGSDLMKILRERDVDPVRTYSNDICEMSAVLGIEAGRKSMEKEITRVLFFDRSYINYRHLSLLSEVMSTKGHLTAVAKPTINRTANPSVSFDDRVNDFLTDDIYFDTTLRRCASQNVVINRLTGFETELSESMRNKQIRSHFMVTRNIEEPIGGETSDFGRECLLPRTIPRGQYSSYAHSARIKPITVEINSFVGRFRSRITPTTCRLRGHFRRFIQRFPDAWRRSFFRRREVRIQNTQHTFQRATNISQPSDIKVKSQRRRIRVNDSHRSLIKQFLLFDI